MDCTYTFDIVLVFWKIEVNGVAENILNKIQILC